MANNNRLTRHQEELYFPLLNFRSHLGHLFDDALRGVSLSEANTSIPKCNMFETEEAYYIEVNLPGMSSKEVDVSLDKNILTIKGEHCDKNNQNNKHYHLKEFSCQSMQRSWELPPNIDAEKLSASFDAGILKIELPKKKPEASVKKIMIKDKA